MLATRTRTRRNVIADAVVIVKIRRCGEEDASAQRTGVVVVVDPGGNASGADNVMAGRQADCELGKAGSGVHGAAFFQADDAVLLLVALDAVLGAEDLAKEGVGHGVVILSEGFFVCVKW